MKTQKFPTREEMMSMNVKRLRSFATDFVSTTEQEKVLQEVINIKMANQLPDNIQISRKGIPDIKTIEEEQKWQKVMDERKSKLIPKIEVKEDEAGINIKVDATDLDKQIEARTEELNQIKSELNKCDKCGFTAKNSNGLRLHSKKHK